MREKPEFLVNPVESMIAFNPMDFGFLDANFTSVCLTHGDGDSFSWVAGGGEYAYSIKRIARGNAKDDGTACSSWELNQTDQADNTDTAYIDTPQLELLDTNGDPLSFKLVNDICNAVIDLRHEVQQLDASLKFIMMEGLAGEEHIIPRREAFLPRNTDIDEDSMESSEIRQTHQSSNDAIRRALESQASSRGDEEVTGVMFVRDARGELRRVEFIGEPPELDKPTEETED